MLKHRGWSIHPKKVANFPFYYAWVYKDDMSEGGFKVQRDDECPDRDRIIELAKWEIDERIDLKGEPWETHAQY